MNGTIITIDTNDALRVGKLQWDGALVSIAPLPHGDLRAICPDGLTVLIERKTPRDFLDSIKDGRLLNQVVGMVDNADFAYVVVTGVFTSYADKVMIDNEFTNWHWHALQGILASIQEAGCTIWYEPDYHEAVRLILSRSHNDIKVKPRRSAYVFTPQESLLMALPGIGDNKALEILKIFGGNLGIALEWLSNPGEFEPKIPGIGTGIKQKINEFLGGKLELKL